MGGLLSIEGIDALGVLVGLLLSIACSTSEHDGKEDEDLERASQWTDMTERGVRTSQKELRARRFSLLVPVRTRRMSARASVVSPPPSPSLNKRRNSSRFPRKREGLQGGLVYKLAIKGGPDLERNNRLNTLR